MARRKDIKKPKSAETSAEASQAGTIRVLFIEDTSGEQFECQVPIATRLNEVAADFFEDRGWPTTDSQGRGQRAVVELVDPKNPDRTKRLKGDMTVDQAGLRDGDTLRVFPESIAGMLNEKIRVPALIQDLNGMIELAAWNKRITFDAKPGHTPTDYDVKIDCPGFRALSSDGHKPIHTVQPHEIKIELGALYPRRAPRVIWKTEIFHPNIHPQNGLVCLGVLIEQFLPGLGVARLVIMLAEMAQWRNFDMTNAYNKAAAEWASNPEHWKYIEEIGGSPFQGPVHELYKLFEREFGRGTETWKRLEFKRINKKRKP